MRKYLWLGVGLLIGVLTIGGACYVRQFLIDLERYNDWMALRGVLSNLSDCANDNDGRVPSAVKHDREGKALCSWRFWSAGISLNDPVQIGYYGQTHDWEKSWDSPENARYRHGPYRQYRGSPDNYIDPCREGEKARFVAIVGPGTAFDADARPNIKSGPKDLILVVEGHNCPAHWMEPGGDLDVRTMPAGIGVGGGIGSVRPGAAGFYVGFANGSVWLLRNDVPFEDLRLFFTIEGAEKNDREKVLGPYRLEIPWSLAE